MPLILWRTLLYDPHRLVYSLPCDIVAAVYEPQRSGRHVEVPPLKAAVEETGLARDLLIAAAEDALIAGVGAPENRRNTRARRFPRSGAGDRLAAAGIDHMVLGFAGIPARMTIRGERGTIDRESRSIEFQIAQA